MDLYSRDLSHGALFLATEAPPEQGTRLQLNIETPGGAVVLFGEAARIVRPGEDAGPVPGMTITLQSLQGDALTALEHLVAVACRHRPPPPPGAVAPGAAPAHHEKRVVPPPPAPAGKGPAAPAAPPPQARGKAPPPIPPPAPAQAAPFELTNPAPGASIHAPVHVDPEPLFQAAADQESLIPVWSESILPSLEPPVANQNGPESMPVIFDGGEAISLLAPEPPADEAPDLAPPGDTSRGHSPRPDPGTDPAPPLAALGAQHVVEEASVRHDSAAPALAAELLVKRALRLIAHKEYKQGVAVLREALERDPDSKAAKLWLQLGQARHASERGDLDRAIECYQSVLELDDHHYEAVRELRKLSAMKKRGLFKRLLSG